MQLLLVRHDVAEPRDPSAGADADPQRPLTGEGQKRARRAARGLARLVEKLDRLGSSGLRRADETARAIAAEFSALEVEQVDALRPGARPEQAAAWLRGLGGAESVALVGHEPALSTLATWLVSGLSTSRIELGKGGACLIELPGRIAPGEGTLVWLLRPGQLRRLR